MSLWEPKPSHNLLDAKAFKGGLVVGGRVLLDEDIPFHITLAEAGEDYEPLTSVPFNFIEIPDDDSY